jgi:hypothetical protein
MSVVRKGQRYLTVRGSHTGETVRIVLVRSNSVVFKCEIKSLKERHRERTHVFLAHKRLIQ